MANNITNMKPDDFIMYLAKHGITDVKQRGDEVSFPCINGCDDDHRGGEEFHMSYNCAKSVFFCLKCGEKGNLATLLKYFGDYKDFVAEQKESKKPVKTGRKPASLDTIVFNAYSKTSEQDRQYFINRGINKDSIDRFLLGTIKIGNHKRYMIPVFDKTGHVVCIKLRRTEEDEKADFLAKTMGKDNPTPKYMVYPTGASLILVGEDQLVKSTSSDVLVCEGELDRIIAIQNKVEMPVVTGGGGAQTFKDEWIDQLANMRNIYICFDRDEAGESGAEKLAQRLAARIPTASIYLITLPFEKNSHSDLTDYFKQKCGTAEELFTKYAKFHCGAKPIDPSQFKELTVDDIADVLNATIKYDYVAKTVVFLAMNSTYTESDQLNVMLNGDSGSGKSHDVIETAKLFPPQDVLIYGKTTPTAFYYSDKLKKTDSETGQTYMDLERRIMVFTEQPDTQLQENLRALLSHDAKKIPFAITNKSKNGKNVAVEGYILGFPSTFFCSANMRIDEQEQTRCLIISPDTSKEKVIAGVDASIDKNSNREAYDERIARDEARNQLKERILYIKSLRVKTIDISDSEYLRARFMENRRALRPKAQREISHFISLVKAMALINAPFRTVDGKIVATNKDVDEVMKIWSKLSKSMIYGISPQAYDFYRDFILGAYFDKKARTNTPVKGVTLDEIRRRYYEQTGSYPNMENVRKQYIPALQCAALISCDKDEDDKRQKLIIPLVDINDGLDKNA